jgi:hypothetical protein
MKNCSSGDSVSQDSRSFAKGISSGVQNDATAFLYMLYRCCSDDLMGKRVYEDMGAL